MEEEKNTFEKVGKGNPFKVPDNYFENFTEQVMNRLEDFPREETPVISMWDRVKPYIYLAAMFVGILCTVRVYTGLTKNIGQNELSLEDTTDEYILSSIDVYTLYDYLEGDE